MKKVFRTISFCLLIAVMLMCAAQAEEITLGQPFEIKLVLPQSSAAKELRVTLNEMTSNNMGLRFGSQTGMTPAQPYAGYMQNNQLYLFSEQGFAAGEIGSMTVTLEEAHRVVEELGIHQYAPAGCSVYADNRIVSFFPGEAMTFTADLGGEFEVYDAVHQRPVGKTRYLELDIAARDCAVFELY